MPEIVNNQYEGNIIAYYGFILLVILSVIRGIIHIFLSDGGIQEVGTVPLDTYSNEAQMTIVGLMALYGLG